ncbi:MAG: hypothetical protein GY800_00130 [Planctomycetes bacterium]|nr:hypothetical protein [Planctomycetota bacterium]
MGRPWVDHGSTMGRPWVDHGSTMGQPWFDQGTFKDTFKGTTSVIRPSPKHLYASASACKAPIERTLRCYDPYIYIYKVVRTSVLHHRTDGVNNEFFDQNTPHRSMDCNTSRLLPT